MSSSAMKWRFGGAITITMLGVAFGAMTAPAKASGIVPACPDPTTQAFLPWGDDAMYAAVPGGDFESGAQGWTLSGKAHVRAGNEPFFVSGSDDGMSLSLPAGSTATSPPMCIGLMSSKMRFFVGGAAGSVKVQVIYNGELSSVLGIFDGGTVESDGTFSPSPAVAMAGGIAPLLTKSVSFRFVATSGSVLLDDVLLDPWKVT